MRSVRSHAEALVVDVHARDENTTSIPTCDVLPEIAFVAVVAGMTCLAMGLAAHATIWTVPGGLALLATGVLLMAEIEASRGAILLLALAGLSVLFELFVLTGYGIHAAGAAATVLLAGLALSGSPDVHPVLAVPASVAFGVVTFGAAFTSWRRRRDLPFDTTPRLIGRGAIVLADAQTGPVAVVGGQIWRVETAERDLSDGQFVRVVQARDDKLVVRAARPLAG